MTKKRKLSTISFVTGTILVIGGLLIWFNTEPTSKIFQLSNDIVGAGLFAAVLGILLKIFGNR